MLASIVKTRLKRETASLEESTGECIVVTLHNKTNLTQICFFSPSIAVVGSITYGMMFLLGPLATSLCQKLGCRVTTMIGCTIAASGCLLGSIATNIYLMDLTYGFLFGVGASMCYFPSVVILGQYFSKRLSLANGITSSGSGVGSLCMGPVLQKLIQQFGLRTTMKVSAGMLSCVVLCALIYRPINTGFLNSHKEPVGKKKSRFAFLKSFRDLFKNKAYILWCASLALWMLGYFVPFVHLVNLISFMFLKTNNTTPKPLYRKLKSPMFYRKLRIPML